MASEGNCKIRSIKDDFRNCLDKIRNEKIEDKNENKVL